MRKNYIVSYDIKDPKRLYRIHKKLRGYGDSLQYSVFLCELSAKEKMIMISELLEIINIKEDNLLLFDIGQSSYATNKKITMFGEKVEIKERSAVII